MKRAVNVYKNKNHFNWRECWGIFLLGRATAPRPKPEIRMIDNTKSIEQAIEATKKQMSEALQKQVVLETHTVRSKSGSSKTDVKEFITYNKNSTENVDQKTTSKVQTSNKQKLEVKEQRSGVDYTFMIGRSFSDSRYDYLASVAVPLVTGVKANAGYEFNDKKIFVGATLNF